MEVSEMVMARRMSTRVAIEAPPTLYTYKYCFLNGGQRDGDGQEDEHKGGN